MNVQEQIENYITSQPESKRSDMRELHRLTLVETLFPEPAIAKRPVADFFDRLRPQRAHTLSSTLRLDHNPRPHQVGDMF